MDSQTSNLMAIGGAVGAAVLGVIGTQITVSNYLFVGLGAGLGSLAGLFVANYQRN